MTPTPTKGVQELPIPPHDEGNPTQALMIECVTHMAAIRTDVVKLKEEVAEVGACLTKQGETVETIFVSLRGRVNEDGTDSVGVLERIRTLEKFQKVILIGCGTFICGIIMGASAWLVNRIFGG